MQYSIVQGYGIPILILGVTDINSFGLTSNYE